MPTRWPRIKALVTPRAFGRVCLPGLLLLGCWAGSGALARAESPIRMEQNDILHAQRGNQLLTWQRWDEAAAEFKIALSLNPYSPLAPALYHNLGVAYRRQRAFSLAMAAAQRAITLAPMSDQYYRGLVDTYHAAGLITRAQERLRQVVAHNPQDAEAWYLLALAAQRNGDTGQAAEALARFVALVPQSRLAQSVRAQTDASDKGYRR